MARILVTRELPGDGLRRLAEAGHELTVHPGERPLAPDALKARAAGADALIATVEDRIDAGLLAAAPRLMAIANYAVGTDNIDLAAARERGIAVGNTPDVLTEATADLTWALMLAAARRIDAAAGSARGGGWTAWQPSGFLGVPVHGATLGVIGHGRIGRAVAARAHGFAMRVLHTRATPVETILAQADVVSLHTPLTPETRHLIDARALARMKPTAILVNTGRGGLVDQAAVIDALAGGRLFAAALDVTDPEPPAPDDPVLHTRGLLVTPHIGSATRHARERMAEICAANLLAALAGEPMPHPVGR